MGVVYKAEDTKLKRTVALKFLPPELTRNREAKERFIQEAQAAAALDHSNICTVYEINEAEGQTFIAMAYIQGQSLKEKIKGGPLKINEVLDISIQVAEGLKEAHDKGVIHRDIKPANIMLTEKGYVSSFWVGVIYHGLSETDKAFEWFDKAFEERDSNLIYTTIPPPFESLRQEPRFKKLLKRMRLENLLNISIGH